MILLIILQSVSFNLKLKYFYCLLLLLSEKPKHQLTSSQPWISHINKAEEVQPIYLHQCIC